jgi:hypothetical protein
MTLIRIDYAARQILGMQVEYHLAYSAGSPERLRIIRNRIDVQYREQFPEALSHLKRRQSTVVPVPAALPKAG